jgi:hypothetical protein
MSKVFYYKATGPTVSDHKWVKRLKDATQVADKQAAEATQKKFPGAELEEVPATTLQTTSKWVVKKLI